MDIKFLLSARKDQGYRGVLEVAFKRSVASSGGSARSCPQRQGRLQFPHLRLRHLVDRVVRCVAPEASATAACCFPKNSRIPLSERHYQQQEQLDRTTNATYAIPLPHTLPSHRKSYSTLSFGIA